MPSVFSSAEIEQLRNFFLNKFKTGFGKESPFNGTGIINDIYRHFPEITAKIFKPEIIAAIKEILGENLICIPECAVHYNRFFDWHKDTTRMQAQGFDLHQKPGALLVQYNLYLQENKEYGGGLTIVKGSHKGRDRFVSWYYGHFFKRGINKLLKLLRISLIHRIEKYEEVYDIPTVAGDVILMNNQLDHRATFKRGRDNLPLPSRKDKLAVFCTFTNNDELAKTYLNSLMKADEAYANFLKQTSLPPALGKVGQELEFRFSYP